MPEQKEKQKKKPKDFYDVIIIGGGISGLTSAALFGRFGISSCVFEMNENVGGYLAGFDRKGFKFDTAIHWLNDCNKTGLVTKVFRIIGSDFPEAKTQKKIRRFVDEKSDYLMTNNPDLLKEELIKKIPADKNGIKKFFRDAKRISKSFDNYINLSRSAETMRIFEKAIFGLKMLKFALPFIPHLKYTGSKGVIKGLNKYSENSEFQNLFGSEPDLLSCLVPVAWAYSDNFQKTPAGGSREYPLWLKKYAEKFGSDIFLNSKVTKVVVENNTAKGVKVLLKNEKINVNCKYVIAASDAETLLNKMLPAGSVSEKKKENLSNAELYSSAFTVSVALNCPAEKLGFGEENIFFFNSNISHKDLTGGDAYKSGIHISAPSVKDKSLAPEGCGTLNLFVPAEIHDNNFWMCEKDSEGNFIRTEKYRYFKKEFAEILINRTAEKFAPELKKYILFYDAATPMTYLRYTGNKNGTMMGQKPGKENILRKVASYKTPVKNLLQSGHWADLGGGVLIAVKSALNTTLTVLKKENKSKFKLLADYIDGKKGVESIRFEL